MFLGVPNFDILENQRLVKKAKICVFKHIQWVDNVSSLKDSCFLLRAISNTTRLAILLSLAKLENASYTKLALSIGLDPFRQSGNFNYHVNYLRKLGLIKIDNLTYSLTDMGKTVASFVDSISTEFILSFPQTEKGGENKKMFTIKELEKADIKPLVLIKYGLLKEETEGVVHDYVNSERIWVYDKECPLGGKDAQNRSLIALDDGKIAGVIYGSKDVTGPIPPDTKAYEKVQEGQLLVHMEVTKEEEKWNVPTGKIYDIWINPIYKEANLERMLIGSFIEKTKDEGCREVWASEITSVRKDLLKALKEEGFKKLETRHTLYKRIT